MHCTKGVLDYIDLPRPIINNISKWTDSKELSKFLLEKKIYVVFEDHVFLDANTVYDSTYLITNSGFVGEYYKYFNKKSIFYIHDTKITLTPMQLHVLSKLEYIEIYQCPRDLIKSISKLNNKTLMSSPLINIITKKQWLSKYSISELLEKMYNIQQNVIRGSDEARYCYEFFELVRRDNKELIDIIYQFFFELSKKNIGDEKLIIKNNIIEMDYAYLSRPQILNINKWNTEDHQLIKFLLEEKIYVKYIKRIYEHEFKIITYLITNEGKIGCYYNVVWPVNKEDKFRIYNTGIHLTPMQLYILSKISINESHNETEQDLINTINSVSKLNNEILSSCLLDVIIETQQISWIVLNKFLNMLYEIQQQTVRGIDEGYCCYEFVMLNRHQENKFIDSIYKFFVAYSIKNLGKID